MASSYCPYLVSSDHIRERQVQLLRRLRQELDGYDAGYSTQLLKGAALTVMLCYRLSSSEWRERLPAQTFDRHLFKDPALPVWMKFVQEWSQSLGSLKTQLLEFSPSLLRFVLDVALRITSVLSKRHFDADEWVHLRTTSDVITMEQIVSHRETIRATASSSSSSSSSSSLLSRCTVDDSVAAARNVDSYSRPVWPHSTLHTICPPDRRIEIPPLPPQTNSRQHLRKWQITHLLAASIVGLICPDHTGNGDINGYRSLGNRYTFFGWFLDSQGIRHEKVRCLVVYFSILKDLCKDHPTELTSHPKMQEIVTVERVVGQAWRLHNSIQPSGLVDHDDSSQRGQHPLWTTVPFWGSSGHATVVPIAPPVSLEDLVHAWEQSTEPLLRPAQCVLGIEDCDGCLQADFANRRFGGGIFRDGMVQEEILFCTFPELLALILICPELDSNEAFVVYGIERYVEHVGYRSSFKCLGSSLKRWIPSIVCHHGGRIGRAPFDLVGHNRIGIRRAVSVAAIDALDMTSNTKAQYTVPLIMRELMKCATAVSANLAYPFNEKQRRPFATGNWGSGAFKGDPQLKFVIQWLATSQLERSMLYCSFHEVRVLGMEQLIKSIMTRDSVTVGDLFKMLVRSVNHQDKVGVWESIIQYWSTEDRL